MEMSRVGMTDGAGPTVARDLQDEAARRVFDRIGAIAFDDLRKDLRVGFVDDRFAVSYQPVVRIADHAVVGLQTSVQWDRAGVDPLAADLFLAVASLEGRYHDGLRFILAKAGEDLIEWRNQGLYPGSVSVTVPTDRLADGTVVDDLLSMLRFSGMAPEFFSIEINERVFAPATIAACGPAILRLADAGFRMMVREVGSGNGALDVLRSYSIDELKIAASLLDGIGDSPASEDAVRAVIALGRTLSADVLAAAVRTGKQYDFLRASGCAFIAGPYVAEPMTRAQCQHWLAAEKDAQINRLAQATRLTSGAMAGNGPGAG